MRKTILMIGIALAAVVVGLVVASPAGTDKGSFITERGKYGIAGGGAKIKIFEDQNGLLNYEVSGTFKGFAGFLAPKWGPTKGRIDPNDAWFFFIESDQRVWGAYGEDLILLEWRDSTVGSYAVIESCAGGPDWELVTEMPEEVYERLPGTVVEFIDEAEAGSRDH